MILGVLLDDPLLTAGNSHGVLPARVLPLQPYGGGEKHTGLSLAYGSYAIWIPLARPEHVMYSLAFFPSRSSLLSLYVLAITRGSYLTASTQKTWSLPQGGCELGFDTPLSCAVLSSLPSIFPLPDASLLVGRQFFVDTVRVHPAIIIRWSLRNLRTLSLNLVPLGSLLPPWKHPTPCTI